MNESVYIRGGIFINIYDIAREAGVSIATISRVINGKSTVNSKTREKVEAVLKKYNYTPSSTARSLSSKTTKSVAVLVEDIREPYYSGVAYAVERELSSLGYAALLHNTGGTAQGISQGLESAVSRRADAAVICGISSQSHEAVAAAALTLPIILINDIVDGQGVYSVICDEIYGMMLAVAHLVSTGRHGIVFIQDCDDYSSKKLSEGFEAGMAMNDLSPNEQIFTTERGFEGGFACANAMLSEGRIFDSVICGDDSTAAGFIKCLRQNFHDVPQNKAVIGFHNTPVAQCCTPALTTVDCRSEKVGAAAVLLLSELFAGKTPERETVILPRLIRGESA
jgi:LacI family transcriptional regulator